MIVPDLRLEVVAGTGLVARWGRVVLVILGALDAPGSEQVQSIVRNAAESGDDGRSLAYRLGAFMGEAGPDGVPSFGVIADGEGDGRTVVLLHGAAMLHATGRGVDETLSAADRPIWVDEYLPAGVDRIEIGPAGVELEPTGADLDLVDGAVPGAGAVLVARGGPKVAPAAESEPHVGEEPDVVAEPEPEDAAGLPDEPAAEEPAFRSVAFTPITAEETREPLPVAGVPEEEAGAEPEGVTVEGVRCIRSHFNHPEARYCAHCGIGMVQQTHQLVRDVRPTLGILVFDDGTTLSLDANYVIGRDPSRDDGVASGAARPFVLEDPDQVLSRVHAEVRLSGWEVELVDRNSANGTHVHAGEWERLPPGEPFTLVPGMKARVGRQEFVFDSHHRRE